MSTGTHGVYRTRTPETGAEYATVHYENAAALESIPRALYEERGYQPPYDRLPTKQEYDAAQGADANQRAKSIVDRVTRDD